MTFNDMPVTRSSLIIASHDGHECRYNRFTHELFDLCGGELRYVGHGTGNTELDVATWIQWLRTKGRGRRLLDGKFC